MAVIQQLVASGGATASFDFSSIPNTYESLVLEISGQGDTALGAVECRIRMNNDSTAGHYYSTYNIISTGGVSAAADVAGGSGYIPSCNAASGPSGVPSSMTITIPGYARTVFKKSYHCLGYVSTGTGSSNQYATTTTGAWLSTAAINQLTALPTAGNWADGTVATLYGIPAS